MIRGLFTKKNLLKSVKVSSMRCFVKGIKVSTNVFQNAEILEEKKAKQHTLDFTLY